jgi:hypothetical protein
VRNLVEGVHAGIRSSGNGEDRARAEPGEHGRERVLEFALHRSKTRLLRPALKSGAVVGDVEPKAREFRRLTLDWAIHDCRVYVAVGA